MIWDKSRALICAGVFCVVAVTGGARAAQVYPGCAEPGPIRKSWYVDPVNGKTPTAGGDGSQAAPWNSLQGVVSSTKQPGFSHPMLSTVPYDHYPQKNAQGARIYADGPSSDPTRVQPGDEILLMGGQYGDVTIGAYAVATTNPAFITIAAAPGQMPVFSTLVSYGVVLLRVFRDRGSEHRRRHAEERRAREGRRPRFRATKLEYRLHEHAHIISRRHVRLDEGAVVGAGAQYRDFRHG